MFLEPVKSLADLEFKAKTNKYYRQLLVIAYKKFNRQSYYHIQGKPVSDVEFQRCIHYFVDYKRDNGYETCYEVCMSINGLCCEVMSEPEPRPEPLPEPKSRPKPDSYIKPKLDYGYYKPNRDYGYYTYYDPYN